MSFAISTVFTEGRHPGEYIKSEAKGMRSRDAAILASGSGVCAAGTVLGAILLGAAVAAANVGNTGNGTIGSIILGPKAKVGTYMVKFTGATTFLVLNPSGMELAPGNSAGSYGANGADPEIAFTFTAGATAMVAGDSIAIAVAAGSGKFKPCIETATDGSEIAAAILYANVDATSSDVPVTITARDSEVFGQRLTWDASISGTPVYLAAATASLAAKSIILR